MDHTERLVLSLQRPAAYPHPVDRVEHIETHISHVLLAGDFAYKLKKPLDLGFLDFSTLERRHFCCREELRLNARLAPEIYLEVVPIADTPDGPAIGAPGPVLEYAVKMRRFPQDALLTTVPVTGPLADRIAERVAAFHADLPAAPEDTPYGTPDTVASFIREGFEQIRARIADPAILAPLAGLEAWTEARLTALAPIIAGRRRDGFVRECHGDMHRRNIALLPARRPHDRSPGARISATGRSEDERSEDQLLIFDAIEFNPRLRWIDTMSELAFLVMDLQEAGQAGAARRLLNRYLELTGDYEGLLVLDLYLVYRALVRAKVTAIRLTQPDVTPAEAARDREELSRYLALAQAYTRPAARILVITQGVSGSGKTHTALALREHLPLIHIRSDIERKRLFGLTAEARTGGGDRDIYDAATTARTYARLSQLVRTILAAGHSPLVDATFLKRSERRAFLDLAAGLGCPAVILHFAAPEAIARARVAHRHALGVDPSEADEAVLALQRASAESLSPDELRHALVVDGEGPVLAVVAAVGGRFAMVVDGDAPRRP